MVNNACIALLFPNLSSDDGYAVFDSWITNGVRVDWLDAFSDDWLVTCVLFGGTDLSAHVGTASVSGSTPLDVTAPGADTEVAFFISSHAGDRVITDTPSAQSTFNFGMFAYDGGSNHSRCMTQVCTDGSSSGDPYRELNTSNVLLNMFQSSTFARRSCQQITNGFRLTSTNSGDATCYYLALSFNGNYSAEMGEIVAPGTGSEVVTAPGFKPQFLACMSVGTGGGRQSGDSASSMGVGVADATNEYSHTITDENGAATINAQSLAVASLIDTPLKDGTTGDVATVTSFDTNGFTLDFSAANEDGAHTWLVIEEDVIVVDPDQGPAFIFADGQATNFVRTYLTGLGYEGGHGRPVTTPSDGGLFQAELINLPDVSGPRVGAPRPDLGARPAGTEAGDSGDFSDHVGGMFDWWEKVHILPRTKIAFGNIITQKQDTYELYSAYRDASVTLSSIVNNALPGIDLPDEAPPEVVPRQSSMLDSTSTDNTGDAFTLGTLVLRDILALQAGLPAFDTTIDFIFDTGEEPQLFISGQRIVLIPMDYESPMQETLAFLTEIIPGLSGVEQRIALRKQPRQLYEVMYKLDGNDRQRMQALLMDWTANLFGFPVQNEVLLTTAAASIGTTVYQVTGADDVDLRVGGLAVILSDANTFDVISIDSKTDTSITSGNPSLNAYPVGTKLMPLRTAVILRMVAGAMAQKNLETFKITFEVTDNDTGALSGSTAAYSTFNGRVLFDDCNVMTGEMAEQYKRRIYRIDNKTGVVSISSSWDRGKRSSQKGFVLRNRSEILNFRRAMISIGGRWIAFYLPTFNDDLEVKATLGVGSDTMDVERIEYERFIQSREPKITFKITFTDGTSLVREVQSAAGVDSTTERLTLDTTWPSTRTADEVVRVQFYELTRFDGDNVRIQYPRIGLATCQMPVFQVFDDN
jgi:hypothetical protein